MPESDGPNQGSFFPTDWNNGSDKAPTNYGQLRRISVEDKITVSDINELRYFIEELYSHTHDYTDNQGGGSTTTTCG